MLAMMLGWSSRLRSVVALAALTAESGMSMEVAVGENGLATPPAFKLQGSTARGRIHLGEEPALSDFPRSAPSAQIDAFLQSFAHLKQDAPGFRLEVIPASEQLLARNRNDEAPGLGILPECYCPLVGQDDHLGHDDISLLNDGDVAPDGIGIPVGVERVLLVILSAVA